MSDFTVSHETPDGKYFRYIVRCETGRNWELTAMHTGVTRVFTSAQALRNFFGELKAHLDRKYPAVAAGEAMAA